MHYPSSPTAAPAVAACACLPHFGIVIRQWKISCSLWRLRVLCDCPRHLKILCFKCMLEFEKVTQLKSSKVINRKKVQSRDIFKCVFEKPLIFFILQRTEEQIDFAPTNTMRRSPILVLCFDLPEISFSSCTWECDGKCWSSRDFCKFAFPFQLAFVEL